MHSKACCLSVAAFFLIPAANALSLSTDRQLLALVPPESAVVAGIGLSPKGERPEGSLLIINKVNWEDISQLFAWTGADASREIHQLMIASMDFMPGGVINHSLFAKGHFDRIRIYSSLIRNGGVNKAYRGVEIATIPQAPNPANRADDTALWLAVLDDHILLLGNEAMIQEELDRYLDGSKPAPALLQRVAQLDPDDVAWSMVPTSGRTKQLNALLSSLDPKLPQILSNGELLVFGIHFKKQIRLEIRVLRNPGSAEDVSESSIETRPRTAHPSSLTFLPSEHLIVRSDVLLSRRAYLKWVAARDTSATLR
jgi:hypothetical protein